MFLFATNPLRKVVRHQDGFRRQDHGAFNHVLELAHVAGPTISKQGFGGLWVNRCDFSLVLRREPVKKPVCEQSNVIGPFAERRDRNGECVDTKVDFAWSRFVMIRRRRPRTSWARGA